MELKFHTPSYEALALKQKEPEESLEDLLQRYEEASDAFNKYMDAKKKAEEPWRRTRINAKGQEETYIDYDAWEEADSKSFMRIAFGEFNGFGQIDTLESLIDIKISHMNQRERESGRSD